MSHSRSKHPLYLRWLWVILAGALCLETKSGLGHIHFSPVSPSPLHVRISDSRAGAELIQRQPRNGGTDGRQQTRRRNISLWQKLKDLFTRRGKDAGTRGKGLCSITPNKARHVYHSWSDRPLFVWQGSMKSIQLYLPGSNPQTKPLWHYQIQGDETSIFYNGIQPLQRGQEYVYHFQYHLEIDNTVHTENGKLFFKVVDQREYDRISQDLSYKQLNIPVDIETTEHIILDRALYFAEQNLFLDAVQEIFSRAPASIDWSRKAEELQQAFCAHYRDETMLTKNRHQAR